MNIAGKHSFFFLSCILVSAAFVIRIGCCISALQDPEKLTRPDTGSYLGPAESLYVSGKWNESADSKVPATLRPILYPSYLSVTMLLFGNKKNKFLFLSGIAGCFLSSLTVLSVILTGSLFAGKKVGIFAGILYMLNLTSIASAPLILADTLLGFLCGWGFYFLVKCFKTKSLTDYFAAFVLFAVGTLAKPVNLPLSLIWLPVILGPFLLKNWKKGLISFSGSYLILIFLFVPFMIRNHSVGAGWSLEANGGNTMYYHNCAAIEAYCTGESAEDIRKRMMTCSEEEFKAHPEQFPDIASKNSCLMSKALNIIKAHPFAAARVMLFQPLILLPDLPVFLENNGLTKDGQGTLAVLHQQGLIKAAGHYLGGRYYLILLPLPFLIATCIMYILDAGCLILWIRKRRWCECMLFLTAVYYLVSPGPVLMPRYQIPALPMLCVMAGFYGIILFRRHCQHFRKG